MFCKHCGSEMHELAAVCVKCGCPKGAGVNFCQNCGEAAAPGSAFCLRCGVPLFQPQKSKRSKIAAGILAIFLGTLGVHNFYLGFTGRAVAQLLITVLTCGAGSVISGIWSLVEGIQILTGSNNKDADGNILQD